MSSAYSTLGRSASSHSRTSPSCNGTVAHLLETSDTVTRSVKYHLKHQWIIEDFGKFFLDPASQPLHPRVISTPFSPSQDSRLQFRLVFYPKGNDKESRNDVFLNLQADFTAELTVHVDFTLSIVGFKSQTGSRIFAAITKYGWLWPRAALLSKKHKALDAEGKLTITAELTILADRIADNSTTPPIDDLQALSLEEHSSSMNNLLVSGKFSDVTLVMEGGKRKVKAHRSILAAHSSVFEKMLQAEMKEKKAGKAVHLVMKKMPFEVCWEMLHFMYTGMVMDMERFDRELLVAANMYDLGMLKKLSEQSLMGKVTSSTAAELLYLAELHLAAQLKAACLSFIHQNLADVMLTEAWDQVALLVAKELRTLEATK